MEITGTIRTILKTQTFANDFKKRGLVITTDEQYPQHIIIEFLKDKTTLLDNYKVGDAVIVATNLQGREYVSPQGEVKYFNTIVGWKINKDKSNPVYNEEVLPPPLPTINQSELSNEIIDDLPF